MSEPVADLIDAKRAMRRLALARRGEARTRHANGAPEAAIAARLTAAGLLAPSSVVSAWLAIGDEIDALAVLRGAGYDVPVALPVMVGKGRPLVFRLWSPGEPLVDRMWGIREPSPAAPEVVPDVLLVPLVAFDRQCNRLGYGGGFYDRTLALLRSRGDVCAIGLAFDEVQVDSVPQATYDEPLDHVVTPTRRLVRAPGDHPTV